MLLRPCRDPRSSDILMPVVKTRNLFQNDSIKPRKGFCRPWNGDECPCPAAAAFDASSVMILRQQPSKSSKLSAKAAVSPPSKSATKRKHEQIRGQPPLCLGNRIGGQVFGAVPLKISPTENHKSEPSTKLEVNRL